MVVGRLPSDADKARGKAAMKTASDRVPRPEGPHPARQTDTARAAPLLQAGRPARRQAPPARGTGVLPAFLHLSEQWLTCSQSRFHFLRQAKGSLQTTQILVGRSDFLRIFGMGQSCDGGGFVSAVRFRPASSAARAGLGHNI